MSIRHLLEIGKMRLMEGDAQGVVGWASFAQQYSVMNASIHKSMLCVF